MEEAPFNPTPTDVTSVFDALLARPEVEVSNQLAVPAWLRSRANPLISLHGPVVPLFLSLSVKSLRLLCPR